MHFSIPDTSECTENGVTYTVFNLHINGAYHCSVRYRLFHSFHEQLKREFGVQNLPNFPPKKLLPLSPTQLDERRAALERYIQILSQNAQISSSDTFNNFLLQAQQESQHEQAIPVVLDVYMVDGDKISLDIISTDKTDSVLQRVAANIQLGEDFVFYFGLYLLRVDDDEELSIVRKLQGFESPYISLKTSNELEPHRIVFRKSYWDPVYDEDLMSDPVALNLLYIQACSDVKKGWILATESELKHLESLRERNSKKQYLKLVRTLKYYSYIQFPVCDVSYPHPGCKALISAGNNELNFRIFTQPDVVKEVNFRVTRMRCWRITSTISDNTQLELAFEYLMSKNNMQWITIYSNQVIVISMCLQGMVDELVMKKEGRKFRKPQDLHKKSDASERSPEGHLHGVGIPNTEVTNGSVPSTVDNDIAVRLLGARRPINRLSENYAFDGIGDDDL